MGGLKDVLAPALSSTNRAKSHWQGTTPKSVTPAINAFACNAVRLVACLACQIMHVARRVLAKATGTGWNLRRRRERVLRASAPPPTIDQGRSQIQKKAIAGFETQRSRSRAGFRR